MQWYTFKFTIKFDLNETQNLDTINDWEMIHENCDQSLALDSAFKY
jgi:hypothetical protein